MAVGFKGSLFGFKRGDVIKYITNSNAEAKQREDKLNDELAVLSNENLCLKDDNCALNDEIAVLKERLNVFEEKRAELEDLSNKIALLYETAKVSSATVMNNAEENRKAVNEQVETNLASLDEVHEMLVALKARINETAGNYNKEVDSLCSSLSTAKDKINDNEIKSNEAVNAYNAVAE